MTGAAALLAAATFNLVCTGATTNGPMFDINAKGSPVRTVIRVDLDSGRWCSGDCATTSEINEIQETSIIFRAKEDERGDDFFAVNRESGKFIDRTRSFSINWSTLTIGTCEKAPFTGFPARRF